MVATVSLLLAACGGAGTSSSGGATGSDAPSAGPGSSGDPGGETGFRDSITWVIDGQPGKISNGADDDPTADLAARLRAAGRGATGGPGEGALLLAAYSLGLGIPFLIAGLGVSRLTGAVRWLRQHTRTVNLVSGVLLVAVGLLLVTDQFFKLSIWFQKNFPATF